MQGKKILLLSLAVIIAFALIFAYQLKNPSLTERKTLKLSDFPEVFKENTVIVIGDNASEIEMQAANNIASYLENETGNKPLVKKYSKVGNEDKRSFNLIVVGTPKTNPLLEDVYAMTNATRVTEEYPGKGKGILEILRNPWNEEKALLLVEGSGKQGVTNGLEELYYLILSKIKFKESKGEEITIKGIARSSISSSWRPKFDECTGAPPYVETELGETYYLANICPYLALLPGEELTADKIIIGEKRLPSFIGKQVEIKGKLEKREIKVPLRKEPNPPTKIETINVIVVSSLEVIK